MLASLMALITAPKKETKPETKEKELQKACTALLFEVIRADFEHTSDEINKLKDILVSRFNLSAEEIKELVDDALDSGEDNIALHPFTSLVNEHYDYDERVQLISLMWSVAYADGQLDKYEDGIIRKVADLLYIRHSDFIKTKLAQANN